MKKLITGISVLVLMGACGKKDANSPGVEYMPDMYRSPSFETNMMTTLDGDTMSANMMPPAGTIARGYLPYPFANDTGGYSAAGRLLKNPILKSPEVLAEGEVLYGKFCVHCHGTAGGGDGKVGQKLPGAPPSYSSGAIKGLPEGKIFHSITYGKGLMGSHRSLLSIEERWKLVHYVQKLQNPEGAAPAAKDSTAAPAAEGAKATEEHKGEHK